MSNSSILIIWLLSTAISSNSLVTSLMGSRVKGNFYMTNPYYEKVTCSLSHLISNDVMGLTVIQRRTLNFQLFEIIHSKSRGKKSEWLERVLVRYRQSALEYFRRKYKRNDSVDILSLMKFMMGSSVDINDLLCIVTFFSDVYRKNLIDLTAIIHQRKNNSIELNPFFLLHSIQVKVLSGESAMIETSLTVINDIRIGEDLSKLLLFIDMTFHRVVLRNRHNLCCGSQSLKAER
jgi:hypothetical protein